MQVNGQIGCFGRSLGGTVVTHLARSYPEHIKFVFVDRSLGNLRTMSNQNFKGKFSQQILECLAPHWSVNSDIDFQHIKCFKMLTQDPWDTTIDQFSALSSQFALRACSDVQTFDSAQLAHFYHILKTLFWLDTKLYVACKFYNLELVDTYYNKPKKQK